MTIEIVSTRGLASSRVKMLVHGPAGAGKTRLAATTGAPTLVISAEAGLLSLREYDIDAVEVSSVDDVREVYTMLRGGGHGYSWVVLDSISEIAETCLRAELAARKDGRAAYGEMASQIFALIRAYRDLPHHVLMIAKQERAVVGETMLFTAMMPGKQLSQGLAYLFDEVFSYRVHHNSETGETRRALQCQPDGSHEAKDRSGALSLFEPPDLAAIVRKITTTTTTNTEGEAS